MNKYIIIIISLLGSVFCQTINEVSDNYKIALRMKLRMEVNPILYMDEPKSAHLNSAFEACKDYIILDESGSKGVLNSKMFKITNDVKSFYETKYYQPIIKKKPPNIRYHYFSLKSDID